MLRGEFVECVRDALNNLYDPNSLRASPLAELFHVDNRVDTPSALRHILVESIESLRPGPEEAVSSRAWRLHDALFYYYVQKFSQQDVAEQIGLSSRHLRRETWAALESLADQLWVRFELQETVAPADCSIERPAPVIDHEIAWLNQPPEAPAVRLVDVLHDVLALTHNLAGQYGSRFAVDVAEPLPDLAVHRTLLRQVLLSVFTVAIHRASREIVISATNSGPLVMVRIEAKRHAHDDAPLSSEDTINMEMAQRLVGMCGGQLTSTMNPSSFASIIALPAVAQVPLLVVDDNLDTLALVQRLMSETRYRAVVTSDPEEAITMIQEHSPRAVLLDVMMPEVDGWELLGRIRQHPSCHDVAVIVCTVLPQRELALSLGAADFVAKPISRQALLDALDRHVGSSAAKSG